MDEQDVATNPVADAGTPAPEAEVVQDELTDGLEAEAVVEDDHEDFEHDGQKYRIPKAVKPLLMMQSDYTRKTQEVAEQRKALEAERATHAEQAEQARKNIVDLAQLYNMNSQLEQFAKVNWEQMWNDDPVKAGALSSQFQALRHHRDQLMGTLQQKEQERVLNAQREAAKRNEEAQAVLKRDIPEWSPELASKLRDFAVSKGGMTAEEVAAVVDPRHVKLLHLAYVGQQLIDKQRQAAKQPPVAAEPVPQVAARTAPARRTLQDMEKAPIEDWVRARNEQLRKAAGR